MPSAMSANGLRLASPMPAFLAFTMPEASLKTSRFGAYDERFAVEGPAI